MTANHIQRKMPTLILLAGVSLFAAGCLEIEITTRVHDDGSVDRSLVFQGDSSSIPVGRSLYGIDSSWLLKYPDTVGGKPSVTASRHFATDVELAAALKGIPGVKVDIRPAVERHFNWFFTTYRYAETWGKLNQINEVPLSDYLSQQELGALTRHLIYKEPFASKGDSLAAEDAGERYQRWEERNKFEAFFRLVLGGVRSLGEPSVKESTVEAKKDDFFTITKNFDYGSGNLQNLAAAYDSVLGTRGMQKAFDANGDSIRGFCDRQKFEQTVIGFGHKVHVMMPGIITKTNAPSVQGNTASWGDFIGFTYIDDYTLWVESSMVNWWAIGISGVLLLAIAILTVTALIRGKKKRAPEVL